jgi:hypothetical protein
MEDRVAAMQGSPSKSASSSGTCVWLAIAAITLASVARAHSGMESARAYAAPVIKFLAANQLTESSASSATHRSVSPSRGNVFGTAFNLLPIFFIGLISPLSLLSARASLGIGRALPTPTLPGLFERPPPVLLA